MHITLEYVLLFFFLGFPFFFFFFFVLILWILDLGSWILDLVSSSYFPECYNAIN